MAENTKIQWTDATVNFWTGCKKVSSGCKFCYMYRDQERYGKDPTEVLQVSEKTINKILKELHKKRLQRESEGNFEPLKVFTCSWSDFFIDEADELRSWAWQIIRENPQFEWQILTKRPERIINSLPKDWGQFGWPHVWIGVSIEDNEAIKRLYYLPHIPAGVRFISFEPILEKLRFTIMELAILKQFVDWAIIGGESGNETGKYRYRSVQFMTFISLIDKLQTANVPTFVKQLGTYQAKELALKDRHGGNIDEWPEPLRIREFPKRKRNIFAPIQQP